MKTSMIAVDSTDLLASVLVPRRESARLGPGSGTSGGFEGLRGGSLVALSGDRGEVELVAGAELGRYPDVGADDDGDHGVAAGRWGIGQQQDRAAVGGHLQGARDQAFARQVSVAGGP